MTKVYSMQSSAQRTKVTTRDDLKEALNVTEARLKFNKELKRAYPIEVLRGIKAEF